jgi:hypothetical protein
MFSETLYIYIVSAQFFSFNKTHDCLKQSNF